MFIQRGNLDLLSQWRTILREENDDSSTTDNKIQTFIARLKSKEKKSLFRLFFESQAPIEEFSPFIQKISSQELSQLVRRNLGILYKEDKKFALIWNRLDSERKRLLRDPSLNFLECMTAYGLYEHLEIMAPTIYEIVPERLSIYFSYTRTVWNPFSFLKLERPNAFKKILRLLELGFPLDDRLKAELIVWSLNPQNVERGTNSPGYAEVMLRVSPRPIPSYHFLYALKAEPSSLPFAPPFLKNGELFNWNSILDDYRNKSNLYEILIDLLKSDNIQLILEIFAALPKESAFIILTFSPYVDDKAYLFYQLFSHRDGSYLHQKLVDLFGRDFIRKIPESIERHQAYNQEITNFLSNLKTL